MLVTCACSLASLKGFNKSTVFFFFGSRGVQETGEEARGSTSRKRSRAAEMHKSIIILETLNGSLIFF